MKMKRNKKLRSFILCMVLMVAMALATTGCNDKPSSNAVTTRRDYHSTAGGQCAARRGTAK